MGRKLGEARKIVGVNVKNDMAAELEKRAKSMNLSTSNYCLIILRGWIESGEKLRLQEK